MSRIIVLLAALLTGTVCRGADPAEADKALVEACSIGNVAEAEAALKRGANPNGLTGDGATPLLHGALKQGETKLVGLLLKAGARTDVQDADRSTALHAAARAYGGEREARVQNLRAILAAGADVHHADRFGNNALAGAAGNDAELVRILLEAGAKVSPAAVASAVSDREIECLDLLLKAGGDLHAPQTGGRTLMHDACGRTWQSADGAKVSAMLDKLSAAGLKPDVADEEGTTPLLLAAENGNNAAIRWLIAHGANVKATDKTGRNALLVALESAEEDRSVYEPLVAAGCPPDAVNKDGETALEIATRRRWWDTVHILLRGGAVPGDAAKALRTALLAWRDSAPPPAAARGIIMRLLRRIPEARAVDSDRLRLLHELVQLHEPSLLKAALRRGAEVNARDDRGRTAWMWAVLTESEAAQKLLRAAGADETLRDADGRSAADLAALFTQPPAPPPVPPAPPPSPPADLFAAVSAADAEAVEKFVAEDKASLQAERVGLRVIHIAALNNEPAIAELLIRLGADAEAKSEEGATPLAYAAACGHVEWSRWFIGRAPDSVRPRLIKEAAGLALREQKNLLAAELLRSGWKPEDGEPQKLLMLAVHKNDPALTRSAIVFRGETSQGGDETDPLHRANGSDVLDAAVRFAGPEVIGCLLAAASDPPERWRSRVNIAFATAIVQKKQAAFDLLLATGLISERPSAQERLAHTVSETPLRLAVRMGCSGMARTLLEKGHKPAAGDNLLGAAMEINLRGLTSSIVKAGAPVDECDEDGLTALHHAASLGNEDGVRELLAAGASVTARTKKGKTAGDLADEEGFPDLADEIRAVVPRR